MNQTNKKKHTTGWVLRILCSIAWVVLLGWLGYVNLLFLYKLISFEYTAISNNAFIIFVTVNVIAYLTLCVWTALVYRTWRQLLLGLGLQAVLICITAFIMCCIRLYGVLRPLTLLYSSEPSGSVAGSFSVGITLIDYGIVFLELCIWQSLAIGSVKLISTIRKLCSRKQPAPAE